jgi:hypothetical protein
VEKEKFGHGETILCGKTYMIEKEQAEKPLLFRLSLFSICCPYRQASTMDAGTRAGRKPLMTQQIHTAAAGALCARPFRGIKADGRAAACRKPKR